ncbi:hypothetical protein FI667_g12322, partial [Globisporangium splendens]
MPRPASSLWLHFRKDAANKRAICKYCQHNMCGLVTRMRAHLARKCPDCPAHVKNEMFDVDLKCKMDHLATTSGVSPPSLSQQQQQAQQLNPQQVSQQATQQHNGGGSAVKKPRRARLPSTASVAMDDAKHDLDSYVAKAVFGAALPVGAVEHPAFVKMVKRLNPNYELPSAFALATTALDLEFTEVQLKLRAEMLDASVVCVGVESWATHMNRSVVSCTINTPNPGVFALETTGELPHTPDVLAEKVESMMAQVGTGKIAVVVMDTSPAMKQAGLVLSAKYPDITFLPSCAHAMNSMMTEMLSLTPIANTLDTCKQIARFFAHNHIARAAFARVGEQMQALEASYPLIEPPDDAGPAALLECLFSVERNRHSFDILLAENGALNALDAHVKEQVISLTFWEEISTYTGLLEPFLDMLKTFDSDYPLLSTFYHRFTLLWGHLEKYGALATKLQQILSDHWQAIRHPAMYTAYLLDPRFSPSSLPAEATSEVLTYLKRSADANAFSNIVSELTRFTGRAGMFADDAIWESAQKCSPIHWWKGFIGSSCPNLQAVALRTLCFPATSGLPKSKRDMYERIVSMNAKYMNEEQASKAALVYLNANYPSPGVEDGVANETIV